MNLGSTHLSHLSVGLLHQRNQAVSHRKISEHGSTQRSIMAMLPLHQDRQPMESSHRPAIPPDQSHQDSRRTQSHWRTLSQGEDHLRWRLQVFQALTGVPWRQYCGLQALTKPGWSTLPVHGTDEELVRLNCNMRQWRGRGGRK